MIQVIVCPNCGCEDIEKRSGIYGSKYFCLKCKKSFPRKQDYGVLEAPLGPDNPNGKVKILME